MNFTWFHVEKSITSRLSRQQLQVCIGVCHAWHFYFQWFRWLSQVEETFCGLVRLWQMNANGFWIFSNDFLLGCGSIEPVIWFACMAWLNWRFDGNSMSKKYTPLRQEARLEVKSVKIAGFEPLLRCQLTNLTHFSHSTNNSQFTIRNSQLTTNN